MARREQRRKHLADGIDLTDPEAMAAADRVHRLRFRSVVLSTTARGLAPVLAVVAISIAARGHNAPGGGFAGGLILSAAVILGYLAEGRRSFDPWRVQPLLARGRRSRRRRRRRGDPTRCSEMRCSSRRSSRSTRRSSAR